MNKAAERISGYKSSEVVGKRCHENILIHTDSNGVCLCNCDTCPAVDSMKTGMAVTDEVFLKHSDGHRVPVMTRIMPRKDSKGK